MFRKWGLVLVFFLGITIFTVLISGRPVEAENDPDEVRAVFVCGRLKQNGKLQDAASVELTVNAIRSSEEFSTSTERIYRGNAEHQPGSHCYSVKLPQSFQTTWDKQSEITFDIFIDYFGVEIPATIERDYKSFYSRVFMVTFDVK
jgi:hypothetical protein